MEVPHTLISAILAGILFSAPAFANDTLNLSILVVGTPGYTGYSASLSPQLVPDDPNPTNIQFHRGTIGSDDAKYTANTNTSNGWSVREPSFYDQVPFVASLNQPWAMILDNGLPTERFYSMSLDVGSLATIDLTPPVIDFPQDASTISTLTPIFHFSIPAGRGPATAMLYHFVYTTNPDGTISGSEVVDQEVAFDPSTTQWSASRALLPGAVYAIDLTVGSFTIPSAGFSPPALSGSVSPADWSSSIDVQLLSHSVFFTPVPEPCTFALFTAAATFLLRPRKPGEGVA